MPEFAPVATVEDLGLLTEEEVRAGFFAGFNGAPEPVASCFSRSFWHGWLTGAAEAGLREPTLDQRLLAHSIQVARPCTDRASPMDPDLLFTLQ